MMPRPTFGGKPGKSEACLYLVDFIGFFERHFLRQQAMKP
jgi:hypothetical protein